MSNSYFRFKQFLVNQEHCAMKVCTDACILGAYANANGSTTLLDIGTGTGLLSLMMAQRYPNLKIDAVEIDALAAKQAKDNFKNSPWSNKLRIIEGDVKAYSFSINKKYEYIICNPPFYEGHLKPGNKANTIARHSDELTLEELSEAVSKLLKPGGKFSVLLPPEGVRQLEAILLTKKLFLNKSFLIKDRVELPVIRIIAEFSFDQKVTTTKTLIIKKDKENYNDDFKALLKGFYLAF